MENSSHSDSSKFLYINVSSYDIGFVHDQSISKTWSVYNDGSYEIKSSIPLADGSEKSIVERGSLSADIFRDLCDVIDCIKWPDSHAMIDDGHVYFATIYNNTGQIIHFGDSATIDGFNKLISILPHSSSASISELKGATMHSKEIAARNQLKSKILAGISLTLLLIVTVILLLTT